MSAVAIPARMLNSLELEPQERRFHTRYPISLAVEYTLLKRGQPERFGFGRTLNVSSNGILFRVDDALPVGRLIKLSMQWPYSLEGGCALRLHIRGIIIRSDIKRAALQIAQHEFRTAGLRAQGA